MTTNSGLSTSPAVGWATRPDLTYLTSPTFVSIRFERTGYGPITGPRPGAGIFRLVSNDEFWRFVFIQDQVKKLAQTAIEFHPMKEGASFNLRRRESKNRGAPGGNRQIKPVAVQAADAYHACRLVLVKLPKFHTFCSI